MATKESEQRALDDLRRRAVRDLENSGTTDELEEWRTRYFGRERGELSAILKGVGKLPPDQRKAVGQAANALKLELEQLLSERSQEVQRQERLAALDQEQL